MNYDLEQAIIRTLDALGRLAREVEQDRDPRYYTEVEYLDSIAHRLRSAKATLETAYRQAKPRN